MMPYVIEILVDILHNLFGQPAVVNGYLLFFRLSARSKPSCHGGNDPLDSRAAAKRANHQFPAVLFLKALVVLKPSFENMPSRTFQVECDHILLSFGVEYG
jgi:hypothetical protein